MGTIVPFCTMIRAVAVLVLIATAALTMAIRSDEYDDEPLQVPCEHQKCCKCNPPNDLKAGWSKQEKDPDFIIWWSCSGSCSLCTEERKQRLIEKKAKVPPGVGYGLVD